MATYAALQAGLAALFTTALGIPCQFRTQPVAVVVGPSATLDLISESGIGVDELSFAENPAEAPTELLPTVHGQREMTVQISVWSASQELDESARFYLSRLRTRLMWPSTLSALSALGLGLVRVEDLVLLDPPQSSRARSGAAMDVRFTYGVAETDGAVPFIETARIRSLSEPTAGTGLLTNVADVVLPDPLQIDTFPPEEP